MAQQEFEIDIPEQGISKRLSLSDVQEFFDNEIAFYQRISVLANQNLQFGQWSMGGQAAILNSARSICQSIRNSISAEQSDQLSEYIRRARSFEIVTGQGKIGERIEVLIANGEAIEAQWLFALCNVGSDKNSPWIAPFRAVALSNPAMLAFSDLASAQAARHNSDLALADAREEQKRLATFIADKTELIEQLVDLYRKKLVIEEPAISWEHVAASKRRAWRLWLLIFAGLVIGPIGAVVYFWNAFSTAISHLATTEAGTISFTGLAAVTLPALFYAWLLKNVSRMFVQTLNLADDAAHRRALAITYLGLAENPKIQLLEAERAIVLNALFRPLPNESGDEGPPAGLMDLIRGGK